MTNPYTGRSVLITGGTGSFGTAMLAHLEGKGCQEVRVFSRDEWKQEELRTRYSTSSNVRFLIGDVRNRDSVEAAMLGADMVFHAAALKQVPSCEFFPLEAVATNVQGSANVLHAAAAHRVERVVMLGTDKAVYPVNVMGMTKALMEKVMHAFARESARNGSRTIVCGVRYGNVMYSRGSVIPLFVEQIRRRTALTLTEPSMTRFLLPLSQAIELVEHAFAHARQGDIFIRKAPACTLSDLAEAVQNVFGRRVGVRHLGIRHGEKVYETLATKHELRLAEDQGDFYRVPMDDRDLNYASYFTEGDPQEVLLDDYHSHNATRLSVPEVEKLLMNLPEIQAELGRV